MYLDKRVASWQHEITTTLNSIKNSGRDLSDLTDAELALLHDRAGRIKEHQERHETNAALEAMFGGGSSSSEADPSAYRGASSAGGLGDIVVGSKSYRELVEGPRPDVFTSRPVEVEVPWARRTKAAITDDDSAAVLSEGSDVAGNYSSGPGADLPVVQTLPGIQAPLYQQPTVAALMAQGTATSNVVRVLMESATVNGAAATHEAADKPASSLTFNAVDFPVHKIATYLPISEELLEDSAPLRQYLNDRMGALVQVEEEDQILNGSGSGDEVDGLLRQVTQEINAASYVNLFDAIAAARMKCQSVGYAEPDAIVINPSDSYDLDIMKASTSGNYLSGGPYSATAAGPWGMRMVRTTAIPSGNVLVGAFRTQAQVFRRGGLRVDFSNSHLDFFRRDLIAVRSEVRLALVVFRANAFCQITNAS